LDNVDQQGRRRVKGQREEWRRREGGKRRVGNRGKLKTK
jgi:hypothetical protein